MTPVLHYQSCTPRGIGVYDWPGLWRCLPSKMYSKPASLQLTPSLVEHSLCTIIILHDRVARLEKRLAHHLNIATDLPQTLCNPAITFLIYISFIYSAYPFVTIIFTCPLLIVFHPEIKSHRQSPHKNTVPTTHQATKHEAASKTSHFECKRRGLGNQCQRPFLGFFFHHE